MFSIVFALLGFIFLIFFMNAGGELMVLGVVMFAVFMGVALGILFVANRVHEFIPF